MIVKRSTLLAAFFALTRVRASQTCTDGQENGVHDEANLTVSLLQSEYAFKVGADVAHSKTVKRDHDTKEVETDGNRGLAWISANRKGEDGINNMCLQKHIVPELFILGAQKAATTTLSGELSQVPGIVLREVFQGEPRLFIKEAHIYDHANRWRNTTYWLKGYPTCIANSRIVTMDATPSYLRLSHMVPGRIKERYGDHAHRLKFVVILREPLARMHSAFYHQKMNRTRSFSNYIEQLLRTGTGTGASIDPFFGSKYYKQLADFLKYFHVDQFTIVPFGGVIKDVSFTQHLATKLGLPPPSSDIRSLHLNTGSHPPLEEDLSLSLTRRARELVYGEAGPQLIGKLLAKKHVQTTSLYGFTGDPNSANDIAHWLQDTW